MSRSSADSNSSLNILARIRDVAHYIAKTTDYTISHNDNPTCLALFPLPAPDCHKLEGRLADLGVSESVIQKISSSFTQSALELRRRWESKFRLPTSATDSLPLRQKLQSTCEIMYKKQLDEWIEKNVEFVAARLHASKKDSISRTAIAKRPFNYEYVPLLEHFFDENAFPSHADKVFLAKKTGMTYRQIHVWFQNRRNRTRKEGGGLKKKTLHAIPELPIDKLLGRMKSHIIPVDQRMLPDDSESSDNEDQNETGKDDVLAHRYNGDNSSSLSPKAPLHAFPSAYPSLCEYDPFPTANGVFQFPIPQWERRPATQLAIRVPTTDLDHLTEQFAKLNVRDDPAHLIRKRRRETTRVITHPELDRSAATLSITTRLFSAPHPAFIPSTIRNVYSSMAPLPVVAASSSRLHVFKTPSPKSRPVTLVPVRRDSPPRKIAPLPKRIPKGTSIAHRSITPTTSESSVSSPSTTCPSRISSFGSASEYHYFSETETTSPSLSSSVRTPISMSPVTLQVTTPMLPIPDFPSRYLPHTVSNLLADSFVPPLAEGRQLNSSLFNSHIEKASYLDFSDILLSANPIHAQS